MSTAIEGPAPPPKSPHTAQHHHHRQPSHQGSMGHSHSHSQAHSPHLVSPTQPRSHGQQPVHYPHHQHSPTSPHIASSHHPSTLVYPSHGIVEPAGQHHQDVYSAEGGQLPTGPMPVDKEEIGGKGVMISRLKRQLWGRQPLSRTWEKQTPPGGPRPQTASYNLEEGGMGSGRRPGSFYLSPAEMGQSVPLPSMSQSHSAPSTPVAS